MRSRTHALYPISVVECGDPGTPLNGNTTGTFINTGSEDAGRVLSTTFGSIVNHMCDEGYRLVGESQRECLSNESWLALLPMFIHK